MSITELHELFLTSEGVSTDTRKIGANTIFFGIKGDNFDGNEFALQAIQKGARYAIVDKIYQPHKNIFQVSDVLETLQQLAKFHRDYLKVPIIGLTGSNGKTTTKELVHGILSKKFDAAATKGNLNNHIGVPLTLLSMNKNTQIGIVEMGANHPGEIAALCKIARPDFGYITNFGKAHLEGFGSIEGVIEAKSELYIFLKKHGKTIFVNADDPQQIKQSQEGNTYSFGENENVSCNVVFLKADPFVEVSFQNSLIKSQLIGKYNAKNIAAAIGIGNYFGVPSGDIKKAVENYAPANNRSQIIEQNGNKIILDAYNANPTSMMAAIESFALMGTAKKKVLVLGDMFEVGQHSKAEHQRMLEEVEKYDFHTAYLCGENFSEAKSTSRKVKLVKNFESLKEQLKEDSVSGAFVLIKGSRGMALERVLEFL